MKTPRLKKDEHGQYPGAISSEHQLSPTEQRKIRESLATGPKYVSAIASECGISMTNPVRVSALSTYITYLGTNTHEAEMIWEQTRSGQRKFTGWRLSELGQKMLELS
jgi:hypothetical protein